MHEYKILYFIKSRLLYAANLFNVVTTRVLRDLCKGHSSNFPNVILSLRWGFCPGVDSTVNN
jgi:hypothetical protein